MICGTLVVAALLSTSAQPSLPDTIQRPEPIEIEATSAPTDSSAHVDQGYRVSFTMDPRLLPNVISLTASDTQPRRRPRAVQYSDWYYRRLQIHRWGSWLELPVFAGEYWLGNKLLSPSEAPASWVKPSHAAVATVLGGLFTINTVTGAWNLYDSRHDTEDRALVWTHTALMLAADAGFALTGLLADDAGHSNSGGDRHRNVALGSIGLATAGTVLMWVKRGF